MNRIELLRLDYLFSVIGPCLLAIYVNGLAITNYLNIIFGWSFLGITGNLLNDAIDKDRGIDYTTKELTAIAVVTFVLGFMLLIHSFILDPITIIFALASIFMVIGYCVKFKQYAIINKFVLVFSHIVFPYLMVKFQAFKLEPSVVSWDPKILWGEIMLLATFIAFSFCGQVIHEAIDKEASPQAYSRRQIQIIVQAASILTIIFGLITVFLLELFYLFPFVIVPLGSMYMFRRPTTPGPHIKDVGILMGNFVTVYVLVLILAGL